AEVMIERAILLHNEDNVLNLFQSVGAGKRLMMPQHVAVHFRGEDGVREDEATEGGAAQSRHNKHGFRSTTHGPSSPASSSSASRFRRVRGRAPPCLGRPDRFAPRQGRTPP